MLFVYCLFSIVLPQQQRGAALFLSQQPMNLVFVFHRTKDIEDGPGAVCLARAGGQPIGGSADVPCVAARTKNGQALCALRDMPAASKPGGSGGLGLHRVMHTLATSGIKNKEKQRTKGVREGASREAARDRP